MLRFVHRTVMDFSGPATQLLNTVSGLMGAFCVMVGICVTH